MPLSYRVRSPLSIVDEMFTALAGTPRSPVVDAGQLGAGTPGQAMTVWELRGLLCRRETPFEVKNRAWSMLIERAQRERQPWMLIAAGVALPRLVRLGAELGQGDVGARAELDAEILTGFLGALAGARTCAQRRFPALLRLARTAGLDWLTQQRIAEFPDAALHQRTAAPAARAAHPDLIMADAVGAGTITTGEAELIIATRLDGRPLRALAGPLGVSAKALWARRDRAEKRLLAALTQAHRGADDDLDHPSEGHPDRARAAATGVGAARRAPCPLAPTALRPGTSRGTGRIGARGVADGVLEGGLHNRFGPAR